jgi:hypothetical protein
MVGAPRSLAPPPRGPVIDVFCVDDGRSQISNTVSQRGHRQHFFALMVGVRVNSRGLFIPENEGGSCDVKVHDTREKIVMANNNCPPRCPINVHMGAYL